MKKIRLFMIAILVQGYGCSASEQDPRTVISLVPELVAESLHDTLAANVTRMFSIPDRICVGDYDGGRVICADTNFQARFILGSKGLGPGEMMSPQYGEWANESYYIFDYMKISVQIFNREGIFEKEFRVPAEYDKSARFAISGPGHIYFSSRFKPSVGLRYNMEFGETETFFGTGNKPQQQKIPADLFKMKDGNLLAVCLSSPKILGFDQAHEVLFEYDLSDFEVIRQREEMKPPKDTPFLAFSKTFSDSQFDHASGRLYLMAFRYHEEINDVLSDTMYELQYLNGSLSLLRTFLLSGRGVDSPTILTFALANGQVFAYDAMNKLFYRYQLPE